MHDIVRCIHVKQITIIDVKQLYKNNRVINCQTCATIFIKINMFAGHYFTIKTQKASLRTKALLVHWGFPQLLSRTFDYSKV